MLSNVYRKWCALAIVRTMNEKRGKNTCHTIHHHFVHRICFCHFSLFFFSTRCFRSASSENENPEKEKWHNKIKSYTHENHMSTKVDTSLFFFSIHKHHGRRANVCQKSCQQQSIRHYSINITVEN